MNHPASGLPFDYEHCCNTCVHFTDKTRTHRGTRFRTTTCAVDPDQRNLDRIGNTMWKAMPACTKHKPKRKRPPGK